MSDISWPNPDRGKKIASNIERMRIAVRSMGAEEKFVVLPPPKKRDFGIIDGETILKKFTTTGKILTHEGEFTPLHIYEAWGTFEEIDKDPDAGCKVHFTDCITLQNMLAKGRYNRYVPGNGEDGKFKCYLPLDDLHGERADYFVKLFPCKHCLKELNYKKFSEFFAAKDKANIKKIVKEFDYEKCFAENRHLLRSPSLSRPLFTDETYPKIKGKNGYPPDWPEISRRTRERHGWKCQKCGVWCGENRGLLEVHHKDGVKGNVRPSNLQSLCLCCHYHEPYHSHKKPKPLELNRLRRLQKQQGIEWKCQKCGVDCSENQGLLHIHHKDGNKKNVKLSNLQVLCLDCHSLEHGPLLAFPG